MLEPLLQDIGLTKGEITVYLTLLQIGETTTGKIIEAAQISSGKIYEILEKLIKKGLVSYIIKEKTKYFSAASPRRIVDYLREKEDRLKQQTEDLLIALPSLEELEQLKKKTYDIRLFQGFRGIQTVAMEALHELTPKDEVLGMGIFSNKPQQFNLFWPKWHKLRIQKKIPCRILFSEKGVYYKKLQTLSYTKIRIISGVTPAAVDIIGDRVLIFTHGEIPSCLSIQHPEIVQSFRTFFETLWGHAKK
ncbi:MAG: helix-turn-helix domain-containing protein [Candidatus Woesearchaeota archaeon]|nr:helix-turn-helix domain-containing protein [Candidatus Woesearchaeota archaeon]